MPFASTRARLIAGVVALPLALAVNPPSASAAPTSPGRFTGFGFDTCKAPSQSEMNELRRESPFWGVGIYIGGRERTCSQPNLTKTWVTKQRAMGWKIMPLYVDRQSACADRDFDTEITTDNAQARREGSASARAAMKDARGLGIAKGSTLFLDIEAYNNVDSPCNQAVLSYLTGWNRTLKSNDYKGGLYASAASGIASLDLLMSTQPDAYTWPTSVWIAHADGKATTSSSKLRSSLFRHQRAKQYVIDVDRTYGSVTLHLDLNKIDIGGGATKAPRRSTCGVRVDFPSYRQLHRGSKGGQVEAAQCLLKKRAHVYGGKVNGRYDAATAAAVSRLQKRAGLTPDRVLSKKTWVALHAVGSGPLVKVGSNSDRVRDLQRALSVALHKRVAATGYFDLTTTSAVRSYQKKVGLDANGVVGPGTWQALKRGKR